MNRFENSKIMPWIALILGFGLTFLIWNFARLDSNNLLREDFDSCVKQISTKIENRIHHYEQLLRGTGGLLNASRLLTRQEFLTYIRTLNLEENHPGTLGVGLVIKATESERAALINRARREVSAKYDIWPKGKRAEYAPIYFIASTETNERIYGYDLYTDKIDRFAMEQARDQDRVVITEKKKSLITDGKPHPSAVMFAPLYKPGTKHDTIANRRTNLIGWVDVVVRVDRMMQSILGDTTSNINPSLGLHIFDGDNTSLEKMLYNSHDHDVQSEDVTQALFYSKKTIRLAGRTWTIVAHSLPEFGSYLHNQRSIGILVGGVFASLLLTALLWQLATGRERAIALAKQINLDLIEREKRYRQMFEDNSSMSYLVDPETGKIVDANSAIARFWGYPLEELRTMNIGDINIAPLTEIMHSLNHPEERKHMPYSARHRLQSGEVRDVEIFVNRLTYQGRTYIYQILHDVTNRKIAEEALLSSKKRLRVIIETAMDAVAQIDSNGIISDWNSRAETMFGWARDEAIGKELIATIVPPHLREQYRQSAQDFLASDNEEVSHSRFESTGQRRDGHAFPIEVSLTTMVNKAGQIEYCAFIHDITNRKRNENALRKARNELENRVFERTTELVRANKRLNSEIVERTQAQEALQQSQDMLRELVAHQDQIREGERKRIAREIHDELGQHLLVLRIDVSMLQRNHENDPELQKEVDAVLGHIDTTMKSVRTIINNLRPSVLDLGLFAALEWQAKEFERRSGIHCELTSNDDHLELDDNTSTVLFRILQEALNNVLKHAKASHVQISLTHAPGSLQMKVADNGIGLPAIQKQNQKSFGLVGIRERLSVLHGTLNVDSSNNGTTLTVTLPLPNQA